jgi:O-antigen ligase
MLSYVAWVSSSLAWAQDGALTFRRLVILGMMCLCALGVSRRLSSRHIVAWILFSTAAYLLIGLLAESVLGSFHPFAPGHRFAGTIHPNLQGLNCALLALSGAAASRTRWRSRNFFRALGLIGFVFLVLTGSRTAFGATVLALLFYWSLVWPRLRTFAVTYSAITILVFLLFVGGGAFLPVLQRAALLGRESSSAGTLSGRILVWQECLGYVANRPFQGYGYGGFWTPIHISEISATQGWGVAEAHSAYLDLLLTVGLIGLVIFILMLAVAISRSVACYRLSQNPAYAFFAALLFLCALEGLMESTVATRSMFSFACMLALANLSFRDAPTGRQTASP